MRERLIEAVARLVNERGIDGFTVDDIARELSISKKTIYKYAEGKDELVSAFLRASLEDNLRRTTDEVGRAQGLPAKLEAALHSYHRYRIPTSTLDGIRRSYPDAWALIEEQRREKLALVRGLVEAGVRSGELRGDLDLDILALLLDRFSAALIEGDFLSERGIGVNEAIAAIEDIMLRGILSPDDAMRE
jgi:AcrR family transcriptional regulator